MTDNNNANPIDKSQLDNAQSSAVPPMLWQIASHCPLHAKQINA